MGGFGQEYNYPMCNQMHDLQKICKDYNITALYVFGSRAAEIVRALNDDTFSLAPSASDLDFGVLAQSNFSLDRKVSLTLDLETLLNAPHVDLFVLQEVDTFLAANIIRGERVFTADSYYTDEYELFVLSRAGDLAELERERIEMILQES
jgi:predicted nucleotidyltransferase